MKYYIIATQPTAQYCLRRLIQDIDPNNQTEVIRSLRKAMNLAEDPSTMILFLCEEQLKYLDIIPALIDHDHRILCVLGESHMIQAANLLKYGVHGLVADSGLSSDCELAIAEVARGGSFYSSEVVQHYLAGANLHSPAETRVTGDSALSRRELEVVQYISVGLSNKEIATELGISHRTIDAHRRSILKKTGVPNSAALVRYALSNQLIT